MNERPGMAALLGVLTTLNLQRAAQLARAGMFAEADSTLISLSDAERNSPRALDLLARIKAQSGRADEARALWTMVLHHDPSHAGANAALARIGTGWTRGRHLWWLARWRVAPAAAALALLWQGAAIARAATGEPVAAEPAAVAAILAAATPAPTRDSVPHPAALPAPSIEGVRAAPAPHGFLLSMEAGLFDDAVEFTGRAQSVLSGLRSYLASLEGKARITVVGHADDRLVRDGSPFVDNHRLALERAARVAAWLTADGVVPWDAITVRSAGDRHPPYANDGAEGRARNRTVSLVVTRASDGPGGR